MASGDVDTEAFLVEPGGSVRPIAEYPRLHWSVKCIPDGDHRGLFEIGATVHVRSWMSAAHRLNRSNVHDALKLRYL